MRRRWPAVGLGLATSLILGLGGCQTPKTLGDHQSCSRKAHYGKPSDANDAAQIAKRMLTDVFSAPSVLAQEPFVAGLDQDRWIVRGSPKGEEQAPFLVMIDAKSGCPVFVGRDY
jgi:hypothetical protein